MEVKTCKQCGEIKPIGQFRQYYGGRKGTYKMCKACERINSREKYLTAKGDELNHAEEAELDKIHKLYEYQRAMGLQPPTRQDRRTTLSEDLDAMLSKYDTMYAKVQETTQSLDVLKLDDTPPELLKWLLEPLTKDPDYYLDEVYDGLVETYRPCTGIDSANMMPVYDNRYKAILDHILARFNEYEDKYYEGAE